LQDETNITTKNKEEITKGDNASITMREHAMKAKEGKKK